MTSKFLKNFCKNFLFSSKNIRQHFFVKYVKTKKHSFGPNGRKNHKIYRRAMEKGVQFFKLFLNYFTQEKYL